MTPQEQLAHFNKLVDRMRQTLISKGNDYAGKTADADRLTNFKQAGYITGINPVKSALNVAAIKISRICTLLDAGSKPDNESVEDSSLDLIVYAILTNALLNEEKFIIKRNNS